LAIILGLGLIIGETIRRYGEWGFWARWLDDYIMGLLLIISAILVLLNKNFGKKLLIAGWSLTVGMTYYSFFSKISPNAKEFQTNIEANSLIFLVGLAFLTSIIGLIWVLMLENKKPVPNTV
jgi:uncharacterized PurR-regulated membrane protein YhhQ (DUF165 family)